jgi:hypothetical protein
MRGLSRRVLVFLSVVSLALASSVPVTAQTSDSVEVTGSIVAAPLSITISTETISFGALDYRATAQPNPGSATGFLADGNNGALWVANTPLSISISSPAAWSATACISVSNGLPTAGLFGMAAMPADAAAANLAFQSSNSFIHPCASAVPWTTSSQPGDATLSRHLGTWVQSTNALGPFTATVQFSISN